MSVNLRDETLRKVIRRAKQLTSMLQGTMVLEGQGLDKKFLREMKRKTIKELLERINSNDSR